MRRARILIVDSRHDRVDAIRSALAGEMLPAPVHREDGESAVLWPGLGDCDMCIVSYELPGIDGLETLARMRNRRPELPAIMIADSQDPSVPIAAFRAGVLDFIPVRGSFARIVAERTQAALAPDGSFPHHAVRDAEDPTIDVELDQLQPTYQNRLRAIGRQLDIYQYSSINISEVDGGFMVRALEQNVKRPLALEFPDRDFPRLVQRAIRDEGAATDLPISTSELAPTGYEDLLRAIGHRLDLVSAEAIVITELEDVIAVGGHGIDETGTVPGRIPMQIFLELGDIETLLDSAFHRRGTHRPQMKQQVEISGRARNILRRLN